MKVKLLLIGLSIILISNLVLTLKSCPTCLFTLEGHEVSAECCEEVEE